MKPNWDFGFALRFGESNATCDSRIIPRGLCVFTSFFTRPNQCESREGSHVPHDRGSKALSSGRQEADVQQTACDTSSPSRTDPPIVPVDPENCLCLSLFDTAKKKTRNCQKSFSPAHPASSVVYCCRTFVVPIITWLSPGA